MWECISNHCRFLSKDPSETAILESGSFTFYLQAVIELSVVLFGICQAYDIGEFERLMPNCELWACKEQNKRVDIYFTVGNKPVLIDYSSVKTSHMSGY